MSKQPKKNQKRDQEKKDKRRHKKQEKQERLDRKEQKDQKKSGPALQARLTPRGDHIFFEHPGKIFQIEFPADWEHQLEDDSRSVGFAPKGRNDVCLSCYIMPYFIDAETITQSPKLVGFCEKMFAQANAINPRRDATIPYFAMKADRNQPKLSGHYWFVAACDVFLGLSSYYPEDEQHLWLPAIERMLSTFRIQRETEALFNRASLRFLGKMREQQPDENYKLEGRELKGQNKAIPLGNLMALIQEDPGHWEAITDQFSDSAIAALGSLQLGVEHLDEVREKIYPFIRPDSFAVDGGRLTRSEWLANLNIAYVIHISRGFRYITDDDLERWGLELHDLHQLAMSNLSQLPIPNAPSDVPAGSLPFVMVATRDNMEASRLLSPQLYEHFAEVLGGPFIAAIPSRDALILFPNHKEMRRSLQQTVRKDFEQTAYPITDRLFLVTPDGITLAEW